MSQYPYFEVLTYENYEQREKWRLILRYFKDIDIFYYPEYVYLFEIKGTGQANCFVYYDSNDAIVIYPFLKRYIKDVPIFNKIDFRLTDIISPYGYCGYLRNNDNINMDNFFVVFHKYCLENHIVSEFVRFNPILNNFKYCSPKINIQEWNETVCIDLSLSQDEILKNMTPSCRNKIRKARENKVEIENDKNFKNIISFIELYNNTMCRLNAKEYYYFQEKWFYNLIELLPDNVALFHAKYNNVIILSTIILFTENCAYYYLSGSNYKMRHLASNNLLLYNVALWAKNRGIKWLHLGGGYQPQDNLFKFKSSFSPIKASFYIGNVIHNQEVYQYLKGIKLKAGQQNNIYYNKYFPEYRKPYYGAETMPDNKKHLIKAHYKQEAEKHNDSPFSTMQDQIVREKEVEFVVNFIKVIKHKKRNRKLKVLDIGCGNGYALNLLSQYHPDNLYLGMYFSSELLSIAKNRGLRNCKFMEGDATSMPIKDNYFDLVYTERCLINILNWEEQKLALSEISRILKPFGYYLMIECFTDGLLNNNKARSECGLSEIEEAYHNKYFQKELLFPFIKGIFSLIEDNNFKSETVNGNTLYSNFLSSHYFISRVLHPLVTKSDWVKNTEFVKFFSFLPPIGNYSPIQAFIFQKPKSMGRSPFPKKA